MAKNGDELDPADAARPADPDEGVQPTKVIEPLDADGQPTEVIAFDEPSRSAPAPAPADRGRRRLGRGARISITVAVIVGVLVAVAVVADVVVRGIAEQRVAAEIRGNLPEGVDGDVDVSIGGFSVIAQYLSGTMDRIELSAPELVVEGAPLDVDVELEGVPVDLASPVRSIDATVVADEASVNHLITVAGVEGGLIFADGAVGYERSIEVLGIPIRVAVTATPIAAGDTVLLESVGVELAAGSASLDVTEIAERLIGDDPLEVCVAEHLPEGVEVNGVTVTDGSVRVTAEARDLRLDRSSIATTGSCG